MASSGQTPNLKSLSRSLGNVAEKKGLDYKDLDILSQIRNGISTVLRELRECDVCGAAVTEIARLEIEGTKASVCAKCGIAALRNKQLKLRHKPPRKATPKPKSAKPVRATKVAPKRRTSKKPTLVAKPKVVAPAKGPSLFDAPKPGNGGTPPVRDDYTGLSKATGLKPALIRRVHKIASDISMPMSFDGTLSFSKAEARNTGVKIEDGQLRDVLKGLVKDHGLRIRQ